MSYPLKFSKLHAGLALVTRMAWGTAMLAIGGICAHGAVMGLANDGEVPTCVVGLLVAIALAALGAWMLIAAFRSPARISAAKTESLLLSLAEFEPRARLALSRAQALADRLGHANVESVHLLFVLSDSRGDASARATLEALLNGCRMRDGTDEKACLSPDLLAVLTLAEHQAGRAQRKAAVADLWGLLITDARSDGLARIAQRLGPDDGARAH